jgi:hypothetical protein
VRYQLNQFVRLIYAERGVAADRFVNLIYRLRPRRIAATLRRTWWLFVITAVTTFVPASPVVARTRGGVPIKIGTPGPIGRPSVAVSSSGTAYVAWAVRKDLSGKDDFIQYCVLRAGDRRCEHSGRLTLADSAFYVGSLQVLQAGRTVMIVADVEGAAKPRVEDYEPVQEWRSTNQGRRFKIVNGGLSVVSGGGYDSNLIPLNAVILPGRDALGYEWLNPGFPEALTFAAVPVGAPTECSQSLAMPLCPFATLGPIKYSAPSPISGGEIASQPGRHPGVLAVYSTQFRSGALACPTVDGSAFSYASAAQTATNHYNISPGSPSSAWKVTIARGDCNVLDQAVAGGASGLGVLEYNNRTGETVYRRFDQAHARFDRQAAIVAKFNDLGSPLGGEVFPSLSQDSAGGIYATYQLGSDQTAALSYSRDGGKHWVGPASINDRGQVEVYLTSAVNARGHGWAVWFHQGSVYARQFAKSDTRP